MTFAEFILSNLTGGVPTEKGRAFYNSLKMNLGPKNFDQLMRSFEPTNAAIAGTPQAEYEVFLQQLFGYDELQAAMNQEPNAA